MRLALLVLVACGAPPWVRDDYRSVAREDARRAAARDHGCPLERIAIRCDASEHWRVMDGLTTVANDDVMPIIVDSVPSWQFELDVCGIARRYGGQDRMIEVRPACTQGVCVRPRPACLNAYRGSWWAMEATSPARCQDAPSDPGLGVELVHGMLGVTATVTASEPRSIGGDCDAPSLMISIDDTWFALCSSRRLAALPIGVSRFPTGIVLAPGPHAIEVVQLHPRAYDFPDDELDPPCRRAPPIDVNVPAVIPRAPLGGA